MNVAEIYEKIVELEEKALYEYIDKQGISVKEYVNPEIMGLLDYQNYVDLYYQLNKECFECEQNPCDEGCPYQFNKESEETNEELEI